MKAKWLVLISQAQMELAVEALVIFDWWEQYNFSEITKTIDYY